MPASALGEEDEPFYGSCKRSYNKHRCYCSSVVSTDPNGLGGKGACVCVSELSEAVLAPRDSGYKLENEEGRVDLFGIAVAVVVLVVQMGLEKGLKSHVLKKKKAFAFHTQNSSRVFFLCLLLIRTTPSYEVTVT